MTTTNKIGLMLVGQKGLEVLETLSKTSLLLADIDWVCAYDDSRVKTPYCFSIRDLANEMGVRFVEGTINQPLEELYDKVDKVFLVGWQYLVPPNDKLVVLHDSKLPTMKGFCPTVWSLIKGEQQLWVTAFKPTDERDEGPIYTKVTKRIDYPIKIKDALTVVAKLSAEAIIRVVQSNKEPANHQIEPEIETYTIWRDELDYHIDWNQSSEEIKRFIDAVGDPYDGAKTNYCGRVITIEEVEVIDDLNFVERHPGKLWNVNGKTAEVICGKGMLRILDARHKENGFRRNSGGYVPVEFKKLRQRLT